VVVVGEGGELSSYKSVAEWVYYNTGWRIYLRGEYLAGEICVSAKGKSVSAVWEKNVQMHAVGTGTGPASEPMRDVGPFLINSMKLLLEKPSVAQLLKNFLTFCRTQRFTTVFTRAPH
jgi:hypothetical protein